MYIHPDYEKVEQVEAIIYHLILTNWKNSDAVLHDDISLKVINPAEIDSYRNLWWAVGKNWNWNGRIEKTDYEISEVLNNENYYAYEICINNKQAGLMEFSIEDGLAEIIYFGLTPDFLGKGFGSQLFNFIINECMSNKATKIWLHTCSLDSPNALPFYLHKGFTLFKITRQIENIYRVKVQ